MCGIVGVVSSSPAGSAKDREKFFRTALIVDQIRGFHSTGFFKVQKPYSQRKDDFGSIHTLKKAFNANDFMEMKAVDTSLSSLHSTDILIGHNRWATMGGVSHATAHPFTHGDITLVHNGTLHFFDDLPGSENFDIDSEAICYALSTVAPDKAPSILEKLDGAYALVWYDARLGKLRAARNTERPLHFCHSDDQKELMIASEAGMLEWLAVRHGFKPGKVWQLKEGVLLTLDREDLTNYVVEDFEIYEDPVGYRQGYKWNEYATGETNKVEPKEGKKGKKGKGVDAKLLDLYGLKAGGQICFDPVEFMFYDGRNKDVNFKGERFGKLVGFVNTPTGEEITAQIDGLKFSEWGDAIGYSVVCEVVNIVERIMQNGDRFPELRCTNPAYIEEYEIDQNGDAVPVELDEEDEGPATKYGPFNTRISDERWDELRERGCEMCGGDILEDEDDLTGWDSSGNPICKHCLALNGWNYGVQ